MEIKHLQSFAAVVRCGSFTKAAEQLFISQPTISFHIRALEEELNQRLILRTTKSMELTPKGHQVYHYAVHILDLQQRMVDACSENQNQIIHLGASTIPSSYILPKLLPEFGKSHPDTYFIIHQGNSQNIIDGLSDGIFDVGLIGQQDDARLTCIPFSADRMVLITPVTEYFLALKELPDLPLDQLMTQPIILREKGSGSKKRADDFLAQAGISEDTLNITARINDQEAIKNLVAGGLGISIISEQAAQNFVDAKRLLKFDLPFSNSRNLYLAYNKDDFIRPHIREFMDFVLKKFSETTPALI